MPIKTFLNLCLLRANPQYRAVTDPYSGQTLTATLSCGNGRCDFAQGARHDTQYSQYVDRNGDVYITIHNHGNRATRFTFTVSIQ